MIKLRKKNKNGENISMVTIQNGGNVKNVISARTRISQWKIV
jgi:hypothetical protein